MDHLFLTAARKKIRFLSPKGMLTTEDLFDLPLTSATGKANLDDIARGLHAQIKDSTEVSFVDDTPTEDSTAKLGLEIVRVVIGIKKAERAAQAKAAENAMLRQRIMEKIDAKKDAALDDKGVAELEEMLKNLS